jgi:hypothetical protein
VDEVGRVSIVVGITRRPSGCDDPTGIVLLDTQPIDMTVLLTVTTAAISTRAA